MFSVFAFLIEIGFEEEYVLEYLRPYKCLLHSSRGAFFFGFLSQLYDVIPVVIRRRVQCGTVSAPRENEFWSV